MNPLDQWGSGGMPWWRGWRPGRRPNLFAIVVAIAVVLLVVLCARLDEVGKTEGVMGIVCLIAIVASMPAAAIVRLLSHDAGTKEKILLLVITGSLWYAVTRGLLYLSQERNSEEGRH